MHEMLPLRVTLTFPHGLQDGIVEEGGKVGDLDGD